MDTLISDNCDPNPTWSQIAGPPSGWLPADTTWFTYEAVDGSGNSTTCTFSIIVGDPESPVITNCPADFSFGTDPGVWTC